MKKAGIKLIACLLAAIMLVAAFTGCNPTATPSGSDTPAGPQDTPSESTPAETDLQAPTEDVNVIEGGKGIYKIVRGEKASDAERKSATDVLSYIKDECGTLLSISDDWTNEKLGVVEAEREILIGKTNREESKLVYDRLRTDDFAVTMVGTKIVIAAFTEEKLSEAVEYFCEKLVKSEDNVALLAADAVFMSSEYTQGEIKINGTPLSRYDIIYGSSADASVKDGAALLSGLLSETFKYSLDVTADNAEESKYEIVFGGSTRGESQDKAATLRTHDYSFYMEGTKIYVIPGGNKRTPAVTAEAFIVKLGELADDSGNIAVEESNIKHDFLNPEYLSDDIVLDGGSITEYRIVYKVGNDQNASLAMYLSNEIEKICGRKLKIVADNQAYAGGKEILIGETTRTEAGGAASGLNNAINELEKEEFLLYHNDSFLYIGGGKNDVTALVAAVNRAIIRLRGVTEEDNAVAFSSAEPISVSYESYSVMTYNDGDNSTTKPKEVAAILNEYDLDFIGMQEVQKAHVKIYEAYMPGYKGVYYDHDRSNYGAPIFYREDKFELLESGTQWLSDTPDVVSSYPESDYIRSYVYAIFRDKSTGREFVMINTHVDYIDAANRLQVAKLLELTEHFREDLPVFYTGDFNVRQTGSGYKQMEKEGFLASFKYIKYPDECGSSIGSTMDSLIDYCFVDCNRMVCIGYDVVDDHQYSASASDHLPIYSRISIVS